MARGIEAPFLAMHFRISFDHAIPDELASELEKSAVYATAHLSSFRLTPDRGAAEIECAEGTEREVTEKVRKLVAAMVGSFRSLGEPEELARLARRDEQPVLADAFAELERRAWVRPLGRGLVGFAGPAFALKRALDDAVRDVARARFGACEEDYPALIETGALAQCGYFSSFPHSVCFASHLTEDFDAIEAFRAANTDGQALHVPDARALNHADAALRPAVCLPIYRSREESALPDGGLTITTTGKAFRYESRNLEGMHRLWDFSMREIVFLGDADFVAQQRARVIDLVTSIAREWDLAGRLVSASDPFFATVRGSKALWQRTRALKYELMVDVGARAVAAASINFAGTLFGDAFHIRTARGETATTACVGFGLERLVLALFAQHGFDAARWPKGLREVVFG